MNEAEDAVLKHLESFKLNTNLSVTLLLEDDIETLNDTETLMSQNQSTEERNNKIDENKIPAYSCSQSDNLIDKSKISVNLENEKYLKLINIGQSLDTIKINLIHIINMQQFIKGRLIIPEHLHMVETWFEKYKHHYFDICYKSVVASILHREQDEQFIKTILCEIVSKVHYTGITYSAVHELFLEMIKWVKAKELSDKIIPESITSNEVLHDIKVQPTTQTRHKRRPRIKCMPKRNEKDANLSLQDNRLKRNDGQLSRLEYLACRISNQFTPQPIISNSPHANYMIHHESNPTPKNSENVTFSPVINYVTSINPDVTLIAQGSCCICNTDTNKKCIGCYQNYYCSTKCQKEHWPVHKFYCIRQSTAR